MNWYSSVVSDHNFQSVEKSHEDNFRHSDLLILGRIQWYLESADNALSEACYTKVYDKDTSMPIFRLQPTDFGREVMDDPIHWWVFKKDPDDAELKSQSESALIVAEKLRQYTKRLHQKYHDYQSYSELLLDLVKFVQSNLPELVKIESYVQYLNARNHFAPAMLFSYRIWGTSRRSERACDIQSKEIQNEPVDTLIKLSEIVSGLADNLLYSFDKGLFDAAGDFLDREESPSNSPSAAVVESDFTIQESKLMRRVSSIVLSKLEEYFAFFRDSIRNVLLELEKKERFHSIIQSDSFWKRFIIEATKSPKRENEWWDFKSTLNFWHIKEGDKKREACEKFCERIASFANSYGGVLIVGVEDNRVVVGIGDARLLENRLADLHKVIARHLGEFSRVIEVREIPIEGSSGELVTCLVIAIPKSAQVIGVKLDKSFSYPVRRGPSTDYNNYRDIEDAKRNIDYDSHDELITALSQFIEESSHPEQAAKNG